MKVSKKIRLSSTTAIRIELIHFLMYPRKPGQRPPRFFFGRGASEKRDGKTGENLTRTTERNPVRFVKVSGRDREKRVGVHRPIMEVGRRSLK